MLGLVGVSCFSIAGYLWLEGTCEDYPTALRHVSFNLVSVALSCGFVSQDYEQWPIFAPLWMLFLANITCSSGSTGGGIKMIRTLILAKTGQPRARPADPPRHRQPGQGGRRRHPQQRGHRGAGLHLPVLRQAWCCSPSC